MPHSGGKICALYSADASRSRASAAVIVVTAWYLDGGVHPIAKYVEEGMPPLRSIWSRPNESGSL